MTADPFETQDQGELSYEDAVAVLQRLAAAVAPDHTSDESFAATKSDLGGILPRVPESNQLSAHWTEKTFRSAHVGFRDAFLDIDTAIPCGLIINELLSNCLKYAFPGEAGEIEISVRSTGEKTVLTGRDDGVGIPDDLDIHETESLGLEIVTSQVDKLDGSIHLTRSPGTTFAVTFSAKHED